MLLPLLRKCALLSRGMRARSDESQSTPPPHHRSSNAMGQIRGGRLRCFEYRVPSHNRYRTIDTSNPMTDSTHFAKLERMYLGANMNREVYVGTRIAIEHGRSQIDYEVTEKLHHAANAMHGSVYFKLLDDAAYFAVASLVVDVFVLTKSFTIELKRPFTVGWIHCEGKVQSVGEQAFIATSVLTTEAGKILAEGRGHFVRGRTALDAGIGYR